MMIRLEPKYKIQPFERKLAIMELGGLINDALKTANYETFGPVHINSDADIEFLWRRLAYWQRIGTEEELKPTLQILLEESTFDIDEYFTSNHLKTKQTKLLDWVQYESQFKAGLYENGHKSQTKRVLRYGPHDLHEYRGKFFPQLVKSLFNYAGIKDGGVIIDPMCGSGTAICESYATGMTPVGLDLNPLSVEITKTKCALLHEDSRDLVDAYSHVVKVLQHSILDTRIETRWNENDIVYLKRWFDFNALCEVHSILSIIEDCYEGTTLDFFKLCLSNIIREISWQKTSDLRVRKEICPYEKGKARVLFLTEIKRQINKLIPYVRLVQSEINLQTFSVRVGDARSIDKEFESYVEECDVLITSPPYATALPYIDTDRLSLIVLGLLPRSDHRDQEYQMIGNREITENQRILLWEDYLKRKDELPSEICELIDLIANTNHNNSVGFRRRNLPALLAKYYLDMHEVLKNTKKMLKPCKYGFFVVGNNSTIVDGKRIEIPTNQFLWKIAEKCGWEQESMIPMELLPSRDIFKENRGSEESILVLKS
ncbi:hypothetical protein DSECCO2_197000 [anaerobic digester metagenome]